MHNLRTVEFSIVFALCVCNLGCSGEGSGDDEVGGENNGVYIECENANQANFYYQFHIPCPLGDDIEGCYAAIVPDRIEACVGPANIDGFMLADWSTTEHTFPYDAAIRSACTEICNNNHQGGQGGSPYPGSCSNAGWSDHATKTGWTPEQGYNCKTAPTSDPLVSDPYAVNIDWANDEIPLSLPLGCSLLETCASSFDADIDQWAQPQAFASDLDEIALDTRRADHIGIANAATIQFDTNLSQRSLVATAEYSASECGDSTCPFYLANFEASNSNDTWTLRFPLSFMAFDPKRVQNLRIRALRSTLGVWRPTSGQVAFLPKSIVFDVHFDVSTDCAGCVGIGDGHHHLTMSNDSVVLGDFDRDGTFTLGHSFDVLGVGARVDVQLDAMEHPPRAAIELGSSVLCNDPHGYVLSANDSASVDPDDDIDYEIWVVDGVAEGNGTVIPLGSHELNLVVVDDRGALDAAGTQHVQVVEGPKCL